MPDGRWRTIAIVRCLKLLLLAGTLTPGVVFTQAPASLRGTVRNETGRPIEFALVTLDPSGANRQTRTDRDGQFTFLGVPPGDRTVRVTFVGYRPYERTVTVTGSTGVDIVLQHLVPTLAGVEVTARRSGLYGTVVSRDSLLPVRAARIEVLGAYKKDTTTADGVFNFPELKPGSYLVRVTHPQFESRLESIVVPLDGAASLDLLVRRGILSGDAHMEMLYREMDLRVAWQGLTAAMIVREELKGEPTTGLDVAMVRTLGFAKASFYPGKEGLESACLFVDGMPRPGAKLSDFSLEEIEAVELYGPPMDRNEPTKSLVTRWPPGAMCGSVTGPRTPFTSGGRAGSASARLSRGALPVQFAVVWLRR